MPERWDEAIAPNRRLRRRGGGSAVAGFDDLRRTAQTEPLQGSTIEKFNEAARRGQESFPNFLDGALVAAQRCFTGLKVGDRHR